MSAAAGAPAEECASVTGLTHEGEGVVRGGKTAFVAGALPGERIRFRRTRRHRQHDEGELLEVLEASPERVTPRCAHFGVCGGCALQHLAPAAQLQAKEAELRDNLERVARVTPAQWLAPLPGPAWGYRRRARLGAKFVRKKGRVLVGFRERAAPYVAQLSRCEVLAPPVGELIAPLAEMLTELSDPRAAAADRGGGGRQRHRTGAARARPRRRPAIWRDCSTSAPRTACASSCSRGAWIQCTSWTPPGSRCATAWGTPACSWNLRRPTSSR